MLKIIELKQERAGLVNELRAHIDQFENKEMDALAKESLAKMEAKFDELNDRIIAGEKQIERERFIGEQIEEAPKNKKPLNELFAKALTGEARYMGEYYNALDLGTDETAGYLTAPVQFVAELIKGLDDMLFMRNLAKVVGPIGAAQSLGYPYRKTEAADATWIGEVVTAPEETTVDYGRREFKPNKMAKLIKVSKTLIQHAPMAEGVVRDELLYRMAAGAENAYLNGNGSSQPLGIFTANANGINTDRDVSTDNTDTAVTINGLINAKYAVKQQYWANGSWVAHRDFAKMVAKMKDGEGQYIWQGSVVTGQPDRLLGAPIYLSEYSPNTFTSGLYVAMFGDFKQGYWICDSDTVSIQVLKELYSVTNQIGYLVEYFGDGAPVLPEAFARVTLSV